MIAAPLPEWEKRFEQTIVPETFVEISMGVIDTEATAGVKSIGTGNRFLVYTDDRCFV